MQCVPCAEMQCFFPGVPVFSAQHLYTHNSPDYCACGLRPGGCGSVLQEEIERLYVAFLLSGGNLSNSCLPGMECVWDLVSRSA